MSTAPPPSTPSSAAPPPAVVAEELELLELTSEALAHREDREGASARDLMDEMKRLRAEIANAKTEDRGAMMAQFQTLSQVAASMERARNQVEIDEGQPYFGHLALSTPRGGIRDILIGARTWVKGDVRIVDWRNAPISRVYYTCDEGEEYELEFGDNVLEGKVLSRRALRISSGELWHIRTPTDRYVRNGDTWQRDSQEARRLAGGGGAALRVYEGSQATNRWLGTEHGGRRARDKHLPEIAALIDPEQFDLITRETEGVVAIRGTAGSGKTTVALHRVAWLAFERPGRFRPERMMVVVWGRAMRDYISHVLPALGVEGVQVRTFDHWAREQRRRLFSNLPAQSTESTPALVTRIKLHPVTLRLIEDYVANTPSAPGTRAQVLDDWAQILTDAKGLEAAFDALSPRPFSADELERASHWLRARYRAVAAWLEGDRDADLDARLDDEDDALLLRLYQLRVGELPNRQKRPLRYAHLVIDEAQDFSALELKVLLGCAGKRPSVTLAGDTQQHLLEGQGFTRWQQVFDELGIPSSAASTLQVSYRCTGHITAFARSVLGDLAEDDMPPQTVREGDPVELFRFDAHGAAVDFLARNLKQLMHEEPSASVILLARSSGMAALYHRGLEQAEVEPLHRVRNQDFTFQPGIQITEAEQVKGLEFDYAVLLETSADEYPDRPASRRLLHVAATRAAHQLWLTCVGDPSPLLPSRLRNAPGVR